MIDCVAWIHVANGRLLTVKPRGIEALYLPGGKPETDESDEDAVCREVREEVTAMLERPSIRHAFTVETDAHGKNLGDIVNMRCYWAYFSGDLRASSEIDSIHWLHASEGLVAEAPALRSVVAILQDDGLMID